MDRTPLINVPYTEIGPNTLNNLQNTPIPDVREDPFSERHTTDPKTLTSATKDVLPSNSGLAHADSPFDQSIAVDRSETNSNDPVGEDARPTGPLFFSNSCRGAGLSADPEADSSVRRESNLGSMAAGQPAPSFIAHLASQLPPGDPVRLALGPDRSPDDRAEQDFALHQRAAACVNECPPFTSAGTTEVLAGQRGSASVYRTTAALEQRVPQSMVNATNSSAFNGVSPAMCHLGSYANNTPRVGNEVPEGQNGLRLYVGQKMAQALPEHPTWEQLQAVAEMARSNPPSTRQSVASGSQRSSVRSSGQPARKSAAPKADNHPLVVHDGVSRSSTKPRSSANNNNNDNNNNNHSNVGGGGGDPDPPSSDNSSTDSESDDDVGNHADSDDGSDQGGGYSRRSTDRAGNGGNGGNGNGGNGGGGGGAGDGGKSGHSGGGKRDDSGKRDANRGGGDDGAHGSSAAGRGSHCSSSTLVVDKSRPRDVNYSSKPSGKEPRDSSRRNMDLAIMIAAINAAQNTKVPKAIRGVTTFTHSLAWAYGKPIQEVLKRCQSLGVGAEEGRDAEPRLQDDLDHVLKAVEPSRLLSSLAASESPVMGAYMRLRRQIVLRLIAVASIYEFPVDASRVAGRHLLQAMTYEANEATKGSNKLSRAFARLDDSTAPSSPSSLLAALDAEYAPSSLMVAEQQWETALDHFVFKDLMSLPSYVFSTAKRYAGDRFPGDKERQQAEASIRFQAWVKRSMQLHALLHDALSSVEALFSDHRFVNSSQEDWLAQFNLMERAGGRLHTKILEYIALSGSQRGSLRLPEKKVAVISAPPAEEAPPSQQQAQAATKAIQQIQQQQQNQSIVSQVVSAIQKQQDTKSQTDQQALNQLVAAMQTPLKQSDSPSPHNKEPPPSFEQQRFVNAVDIEPGKDTAALVDRTADLSHADHVPRGYWSYNYKWLADYGIPTQMGPEEQKRPPLMIRAIAKELGWILPASFDDTVGLGGEQCAACVLRGVEKWWLHPLDKNFTGSQKPKLASCGYVHNICKCRHVYAAVHRACRADVDAGRAPRLWLFDARPQT